MVKSELEDLGVDYESIELGEIELVEPLSEDNRQQLTKDLHKSGLELMEDRKAVMVEKIISIIDEMVEHGEELPKVNFSTFLSKKMNLSYQKMAKIFSKSEGITVEHFIILRKVEKIKELITSDKLNLTEISHEMNYSSVAHLSNQFKKVTGFTPTFFKSLSQQERVSVEG